MRKVTKQLDATLEPATLLLGTGSGHKYQKITSKIGILLKTKLHEKGTISDIG